MKILIFDVDIAGHHLEYLHHFYEGALARTSDDFVFFVSPKFEECKNMYEWPEAQNIVFLHCTEKHAVDCVCEKAWKAGVCYSWLLRKTINAVNPDYVLLTSITVFIPFARFFLPSHSRIRGIMYTIYSYEKDMWPKWRLGIERWRIRLSVGSEIFDKIYLLNDESSCKQWNEFYGTNKFSYLVDPVPNVDVASCSNIRERLNIPENDTMFLHFGGMAERKGTLNILKAILHSDVESLRGKTFVFAGRVYSDIYDEFYRLLDEAGKKTNILVFDSFVTYDFIYNLCFSTDFILMPYQMSNLSSGLLGYASVFRKTVIGPERGLLGTLISRYNLGYVIDAADIGKISASFSYLPKKLNPIYGEINTRERFLSQLFDVK